MSKTKVFILVTLRDGNEALARHVFKTLRVGFPTAEVVVHMNGLDETPITTSIKMEAEAVGCTVSYVEETIHHKWIERLIYGNDEPFWLVDTDLILYGKVEDWTFETPLAGALIPEFHDEFTKCITRSRLHTSLMCLDPVKLRQAQLTWLHKQPVTEFNPAVNLVHPVMYPQDGRTFFFDTMALYHHAVGGTAFTPKQMDAFFHFHFGTYADLVIPLMEAGDRVVAKRAEIMANPEAGRGQWRAQLEYFESRQVIIDGENVIAPIDNQDAVEARKWNEALCNGNEAAMAFCDLWYTYVHGLDDLIDTMRDGRPRMSKDQIVSLFLRALFVYNCDFFIAHRQVLAPVIILITNTYRDSIAWENSSQEHLRKMGDVFRTVGNEAYVIVALICGGEDHMRKMSMAIKDRDFSLQHTKDGYPL